MDGSNWAGFSGKYTIIKWCETSSVIRLSCMRLGMIRLAADRIGDVGAWMELTQNVSGWSENAEYSVLWFMVRVDGHAVKRELRRWDEKRDVDKLQFLEYVFSLERVCFQSSFREFGLMGHNSDVISMNRCMHRTRVICMMWSTAVHWLTTSYFSGLSQVSGEDDVVTWNSAHTPTRF